jgi:hypothetical protein
MVMRFFMFKVAKKLFESTGYKIVHVDRIGLASKNLLFIFFHCVKLCLYILNISS